MRHVWLLEQYEAHESSHIMGVYSSRNRALAAAEVEFVKKRSAMAKVEAECGEDFGSHALYVVPTRSKIGGDVTSWTHGSETYTVYRMEIE